MKSILIMFLAFGLVGALEAAQPKKMACRNLEEACKAAGYSKMGHMKDHMNMKVDCIGPVLSGSEIKGVSVMKDDVEACKLSMEKRKSKSLQVKKEAAEKRVEGHSN